MHFLMWCGQNIPSMLIDSCFTTNVFFIHVSKLDGMTIHVNGRVIELIATLHTLSRLSPVAK